MNTYEYWLAKSRNEAILWAREVLDSPEKYVIFDTETTGLRENDLIIHLAVMDLMRNMLIDTMVKPVSKRRIAEGAKDVHGLTLKDLKDAPIFESVVKDFVKVVEGKRILSFNAEFHERMFLQSYYNEGVSEVLPKLDFEDVQSKFDKFMSRDRLALPGRKNTGIGDCNATLDLIVRIADAELTELPESNPDTEPAFIRQSNKKSSIRGCLFVLFMALGIPFMPKFWYIGVPIVGLGVYFLYKKD